MLPYFSFQSFSLGPMTIQVWGLLVALGFLTSLIIFWQKGRQNNLSTEKILNLGLGVIVCSLFFARLFYILFGGDLKTFTAAPWLFFALWQGGMSSVGGFFGTGLVLMWFWRREQSSPPISLPAGRQGGVRGGLFWPYLETLAYSFPFGWLIGRVGCFLIHDHPGRLTNSFFGVNFPQGARFDMALLEILALLPLAIIFLFLAQWKNRGGQKFLAPTYSSWLLLWYGLTRFFLDFWRASDLPFSDPRYWGLTLGQWGGLGLIFLGLFLSFKKLKRSKYIKKGEALMKNASKVGFG